MPHTKKQLVTTFSVVYLVIITALAGYACSRSNDFSIPIPSVLSGFTAALPIISGLLLEAGYDVTRILEKRKDLPRGPRPPFIVLSHTLILIYSTVVITLLGTHVSPADDLTCGLERTWQSLFHGKDSASVRKIQDHFQCCGFHTTHDRPWPFPDKTHKVTACERSTRRTKSCLGPWRAEEQQLAGLLMGVVGFVFLWQLSIIITPLVSNRESWLHQVLPEQLQRRLTRSRDEEHNSAERNAGGRNRAAIDYQPYRDEDSESEEGSATAGATRSIEDSARSAKDRVANTLTGHANSGDSPTQAENEWARDH